MFHPLSFLLYPDLEGEDKLPTWVDVMSHSSKVCREIDLLSPSLWPDPHLLAPCDLGQLETVPCRLPRH